MWEQAKSASHRGSPVRRIFSFVLAVVVTVFLWTSLSGSISNAVSGDATWNGDSLMYNSEQFTSNGTTTNQNGLSLPKGASYYSYVDQNNNNPSQSKIDILYFTSGQSASSATSAQYVEYNLDMSSEPYQFSDPHGSQTVTIDSSGGGQSQGTSCAITGVGWIVCSVSNFLATGMDWLLNNILQNFLLVHPLSTTASNNNSLYQAWNVIRSIANVAFIIVFLIIIYSQLSGFGVNNYGIKKLLPRLIVAAIIVNLSYYICAVAVDLSNVIGVSIEKVMEALRNNLYHVTNSSTAGQSSWTSVTGFVLSGGTAAVAGGAGVMALATATGGSVTSLIFIVLPALVGLILAALLAFLILAARQALIIILTIVSPLAFVAYLLPNTEQWFKKWRQTFTTMLVFFPAFALVFAGAQLAGGLIIENSSSLTTMILGMIVQVIPLAITPLLLRLSGNTIQSIAKVGQNLNKRMQGATSNWAKPRAEAFKKQALGADLRAGNLARRLGRWNNYRQQAVKQRGEAGEANFDAYTKKRTASIRTGQNRLQRLQQGKDRAAVVQSMIEKANADMQAGSTQGWQELRAVRSGAGHIDSYLDNEGTLSQAFMDRSTSARMDKKFTSDKVATRALGSAAKLVNRSSITGQATHNAKHLYEEALGKQMKASEEMRRQAGGINTHDDAGASIAFASAINTVNKAGAENVSAASTVIADFQLDTGQLGTLSANGTVANSKGEILHGDIFQKAAFNSITKMGIASFIQNTLEKSSTMSEEMRAGIKGTLDTNHSDVKKTTFWAVDDSVKNAVVEGKHIDTSMIYDVMASQFAGKKVPRSLLATQDADTLKLVLKGMQDGKITGDAFNEAKKLAGELFGDDLLTKDMKDVAIDVIATIKDL